MKPEKLQALLLKLRKGADGAIRMPELLQVLDNLGGFQVNEVLVLQSENTYGNPNEPQRFFDTHPGAAKTVWERAKAGEVRTLPGPGQLKEYETYYLNVSELVPHNNGWLFTAIAWRAVPGTKVTAPNHAVFEIAKAGESFLRDYPQNNKFLKWLKGDAKYLDIINDRLGLESFEVEREKARTPPRTRGNTGTCPACSGNFKLTPRTKHGKDKTMPGMILHGYKRPGTGYVHGNCFGQDWPPFELSKEGTVAFIDELEEMRITIVAKVDRLERGDVDFLEDPYQQNRLLKKNEADPRAWERALKSAVEKNKTSLSMIDMELQRLHRMADAWKPEPLPQELAL